MPAKSVSPQAAQIRLWKGDVKELQKRRRKIEREFKSEWSRLYKLHLAANAALKKYEKRTDKLRPRALSDIDRRIAILSGRIGI